MINLNPKVQYLFGLQWIFLTTIGLAFGWTLGNIAHLFLFDMLDPGLLMRADLTTIISPVFLADLTATALGGILTGALLGTLQWLTLRRQVTKAGWWILASIEGWLLGRVFIRIACSISDFTSISLNIDDTICRVHGNQIVIMAFIGLGLGILQWLVLRKQITQI